MGFTDVTSESGIGFEVGYGRPLSDAEVEEVAPSGVAAGDYDGDGWVDLVIVRGDVGPNLLYRNLGGLRFEERAQAAGIAWSLAEGENLRHGSPGLADLDGDDDLDILLPGMGHDPARLYRNEGDGTFRDVTPGSGLDQIRAEFSFSPAFGDYDLDGDLDMLLAHWGTPIESSEAVVETEHLWRNDTDEVGMLFTPVTLEAGIAPSILYPEDPLITLEGEDFTFSPSFARFTQDRYPDVLMVADYNYTQLYENLLDGTFANITDYSVVLDDNGMGSALGDYDSDGDLDWFVSSIYTPSNVPVNGNPHIGNRLYVNEGGRLIDDTERAGVADGGWGWGSCFLDIENDGDLDIYHTNGWSVLTDDVDFSDDRSRAFINNGDGVFEEQAGSLGIDDSHSGRGVICTDFDKDGDTDILLLHTGTSASATLWRNDTEGNNYLAVKLEGRPPNTGAVGARIHIQADSGEQLREVGLNSNYLSHNPTDQLFGLGQTERIDTLTVEWPDGSETLMQDLAVNQEVTITHPQG